MGAARDIFGAIPYRIALAGGWIDQPIVSRNNPDPPGSMVVVQVKPTFRWMDRAGIATSTRLVAARLWDGRIPDGDRMTLVRELYAAENEGRSEPSGSQDMIGILYPGISRLDYDAHYEDGFFPIEIESNNNPDVAAWLESVLHVVPVAPRPAGYSPLGRRNPDPEWIGRLGRTGRECFESIISCDRMRLAASFNECMSCWEAILPDTVDHPSLTVDLRLLLRHYQFRYQGAMYSGCGGGYLFVISEEPVPGSFRLEVSIEEDGP